MYRVPFFTYFVRFSVDGMAFLWDVSLIVLVLLYLWVRSTGAVSQYEYAWQYIYTGSTDALIGTAAQISTFTVL